MFIDGCQAELCFGINFFDVRNMKVCLVPSTTLNTKKKVKIVLKIYEMIQEVVAYQTGVFSEQALPSSKMGKKLFQGLEKFSPFIGSLITPRK